MIPAARGRILREGAPTDKFSQLDLRRGAIEYANNVSADSTIATKDSMRFSVEVPGDTAGPEGARAEAEMVFHIFSESYWEPLVVVSNNSLLVEESTSIAITAYDLQVRFTEREAALLRHPLRVNECILLPSLSISREEKYPCLGNGDSAKTCWESIRWPYDC